REVVLAGKLAGRRPHRLEIERPGHQPRVVKFEGGTRVAVEHPIFVDTRARVTPGIKIRWRGLGGEHRDVGRQERIERRLQVGGIECTWQQRRGALAVGMDSAIGPARAADSDRRPKDLPQGGFEATLNRVLVCLQLPAGVSASVVLERELYAHQFATGAVIAKVSAIQTAVSAASRVLSNAHHRLTPARLCSALIWIASCPTASIIESGCPSSISTTPGVARRFSSHRSPLVSTLAETVNPVPCRMGMETSCTASEDSAATVIAAVCAATRSASARSVSREKTLNARCTSSSS